MRPSNVKPETFRAFVSLADRFLSSSLHPPSTAPKMGIDLIFYKKGTIAKLQEKILIMFYVKIITLLENLIEKVESSIR